MRKFIYILLCAIALTSCINDKMPEVNEYVEVGDILSDFSVKMNDGTIYSMFASSLIPRVYVIINDNGVAN